MARNNNRSLSIGMTPGTIVVDNACPITYINIFCNHLLALGLLRSIVQGRPRPLLIKPATGHSGSRDKYITALLKITVICYVLQVASVAIERRKQTC